MYSRTPTVERLTVDKSSSALSFTLDWTTASSKSKNANAANGRVAFDETSFGIVNTTWSGTPPPVAFPVLCASASSCGTSLASTYYNVIWGARSPTLAEPVLQGLTWTSTGGTNNDVASTSTYLGVDMVKVPAFASPVPAARVETNITQVGALGDPYGSGVRTTWWVYGVGPVMVVFTHAGRLGAVTRAVLESTDLKPLPPPSDVDYFPLRTNVGGVFRWTNPRHLKTPETEKFAVTQSSNGSAVFRFTSLSGPIKATGGYEFATRTDGVKLVSAATKSATLTPLPPLGPGNLPSKKRRHFVTPFDLMVFGFNPLLSAYPTAGDHWSADTSSREFSIFGVTGTTRVVGVERVTVPAGTFDALVVDSTLNQRGFPFGSGTRTVWFAPNRGLVKLVFHHDDGSTSTVELLR